MKTSPRSLLMASGFFVLMVDFLVDMTLYGTFAGKTLPPNVSQYLNWSSAVSTATNDLGGSWSFLGYSFSFIESFFINFLAVFVAIYNFFNFIYQGIVWTFSLIDYPFSVLTSSGNTTISNIGTFLTIVFYMLIAVSMLFAIQIFMSGARNDE